jgi:hypothetical protein
LLIPTLFIASTKILGFSFPKFPYFCFTKIQFLFGQSTWGLSKIIKNMGIYIHIQPILLIWSLKTYLNFDLLHWLLQLKDTQGIGLSCFLFQKPITQLDPNPELFLDACMILKLLNAHPNLHIWSLYSIFMFWHQLLIWKFKLHGGWKHDKIYNSITLVVYLSS